MWKNGTSKFQERKSGTNSLKPWSEKHIVYILIICYPMYIYICFAYTKETLEAYKNGIDFSLNTL